MPDPHATLRAQAAAFIPRDRIVDDPLRLLAWGTDASFYRLVPKVAIVVESEAEVSRLLSLAAGLGTPVTFRAAGTSLSGQAVSDSVLVLLGDGWRRARPSPDGATIALQPGVIGAAANRALARFGRKIGPDPASIDAAMIGGIAANNASGMCCGTAQNSYRTLEGLRVVLADGSILDTRVGASREAYRLSHAAMLGELRSLGEATRSDAVLAGRIRRKFALKNTTGYSLNALLDFEDPIDILAHLLIGSEGTLGFISEITYRTVPEHAHKASALILFDDLGEACRAVALLKDHPVAAVELADRAALRSVEGKPGLPASIAAVGPDGAALLVETRAPEAGTLAAQVASIEAALAGAPTREPARFSTDPQECARYWKVRKGMFPSVGAMRRTGTTTIIEDVAFPVPRLAEATRDLQRLLAAHGYPDAIVFGHALEGNLHFVFAQDFNTAAEVERYRLFMDALARMVVEKYDGSLKAEHGTGRNMAPYVELEWGAQATALMRRLKALIDPAGLLNPGVILNPDPGAHVRDLKPLPACDPLVDKCIECGFCEPKCPSRGLTLSPRQRIAGWREIARRERAGEGDGGLARAYDYLGIDTCAACGLCATACPVGIDTGALIKALRARRAGPLARAAAEGFASGYGAATLAMRAGLAAASPAHGLLPHPARMLPRPARLAPARGSGSAGEPIVYFPSCASRTFGPAHGDGAEALPVVAERLFGKAGFAVRRPERLAGLCCGQPFESKGFPQAADRKAAELEAALAEASEGGRIPIVFDTSPCAWRMSRFLAGRLDVRDGIEFVHDVVLARVSIERREPSVAVHAVCSARKMGLEEKLAAVASRCSERVVIPPEVQCCGFAGDKGFTRPELNAHALRHVREGLPADCRAGYSSSRTCELGLSGHAGIAYRSIIHLVDACAEPIGAGKEAGRQA
jgi:D-lactate dehydrogenase